MKAQIFSMDFIGAVLIFLILIGFIITTHNQVLDNHLKDLERKYLENDGVKVMGELLRTSGLPENWEDLLLQEYSVDSNTIGLYHINEGIGGTTEDGSNTNPIQGDLEPDPPNGPAWKSGSACKINRCLEFDGVNDWIKIKHSDAYSVRNYTVEMWIQPISGATSQKPDQKIIYKDGQFYIKIVTGNVLKFLVNGIGEFTTASSIPLQNWTHISLTVKHLPTQFKTEVRFYINGSPATISGPCGTGIVLQCSGTPLFSTNDVGLGSQLGQNYFNGRIDEFRFSNITRTSFNIDGSDPIEIGLADGNNNILNNKKVDTFFNLDYNKTKNIFGIGADFELSFVNSNKTKGLSPDSSVENIIFFRRLGVYNNSIETVELKLWRR